MKVCMNVETGVHVWYLPTSACEQKGIILSKCTLIKEMDAKGNRRKSFMSTRCNWAGMEKDGGVSCVCVCLYLGAVLEQLLFSLIYLAQADFSASF